MESRIVAVAALMIGLATLASAGTHLPLLAGRRRVAHRAVDLEALIDEVKKLPSVDARRVVLMGHSAGSEIVTRVANRRMDIAAVATMGGGVLQLMDYLREDGDVASCSRRSSGPRSRISP
jgi:dienelactone hydrolase